jgi:hypothetical protein
MAETPADVLVGGDTSIDAATEDVARPPRRLAKVDLRLGDIRRGQRRRHGPRAGGGVIAAHAGQDVVRAPGSP